MSQEQKRQVRFVLRRLKLVERLFKESKTFLHPVFDEEEYINRIKKDLTKSSSKLSLFANIDKELLWMVILKFFKNKIWFNYHSKHRR